MHKPEGISFQFLLNNTLIELKLRMFAPAEHLISNVLPYYLGRDHQPSGARKQAESIPESDRIPEAARILVRIPERVSEGEAISEAAGVSKAGSEVLPGSKGGFSCQEEEQSGGSGRRFDPDSGGPQIAVAGEESRGLEEEAVERQGSGALAGVLLGVLTV